MFLIPQQIPWMRQPQVLSALEPEYDDVCLLAIAGRLEHAANHSVVLSGLTLDPSISGLAFVSPGAGAAHTATISNFPSSAIAGDKRWTMLVLQYFSSTPGNVGILGLRVGSGSAFCAFGGLLAFYTGSAFATFSGTPSIVAGLRCVAITSNGDGTGEWFMDGARGTISGLGAGAYSNTSTLQLMNWDYTADGIYSPSAGSYQAFAGVFSDRLPASVLAEITRTKNPWQIFQPQTQYLFIPTIAGGGPANITGTLSSTLESINTAIQGSLGHGGTLSISLDTIAVTGSGVLNHIGTSTSTLDDVVVTFSGAVDTAGSVSGTLACTLDIIVFSGAGNLNHSTTINITLDDIFVSLAGTVAGTPENIDGTLSIVLDGIGFTSSGNSGTLTLTDDDINAIMTAIINNPKTLTIPKFLGLK